jgi:catechol 2,3-dioxygenase-like lactoylglutathione lyase family enzyme
MRITGIEELTFGVDDIATSAKFCSDFGLERISTDPEIFETRDGGRIILRPMDDPGLPKAITGGPTLRELTWGVKDSATLDEIRAELEKDRQTTFDGKTLRSVDDIGLAIDFTVTARRAVEEPLPAVNVPGHIQRGVNRRIEVKKDIRPRGIAHVVLDCVDEPTARRFYIDRLGFKVSDSFRDAGAFLRTSIKSEHHCLFTVKRDQTGLNHVAFYLTDFHEVMLGGAGMIEAGWATRWGPGRHRLGSNYFWYINAPIGGAFEYTCDGDHVDDAWEPIELEFSRENSAIWSTQYIAPPKH